MKSITSNLIRERANKKYAAYSRKNALAMYRSIQDQQKGKRQPQQKVTKYDEIYQGDEQLTNNMARNSKRFLASSVERDGGAESLPDMKLRNSV